MPRDGDPRIMVRMAPEDLAVIEGAARSVNVATGALIRECAVRYAATVAREVRAGDLRLRRARVEVAAASAPVVRARALVPESAAALAMDHQRRLNEAAERARAGRRKP